MVTSTFSHIKKTILSHPISIGILTLAIIQALFGALKVGQLLDYPAYIGAAKSWLNHQNPYSQNYPNAMGEVNFIYPPGSLLVFAPFTFMPPRAGEIIFTIGSLTMMLITLLIVARKTLTNIPLDYKLLIIAFFIQTFSVKFNLTLGQANMYVLGLSVIALYLIHQKPTLTSILLSLAISIKPFPLILLIPLFTKRKYKVLLQTIFITLFINLMTGSLGQYVSTILPNQLTSTAIPNPDFYNISINASIYHLFNINPSLNLGLLLATILLFVIIANRKQTLFDQSINLLAVSIMFPINSWTHYLVFAYPLLLSKYSFPLTFIPLWLVLAFHLPHPNREITYHAPITGIHNAIIYGLIIYASLADKFKKTLKRHRTVLNR